MPAKVLEHPFPAKWLAIQLELLGNRRILMRSDGERTLVSLNKATVAMTTAAAVPVVERMVQPKV